MNWHHHQQHRFLPSLAASLLVAVAGSVAQSRPAQWPMDGLMEGGRQILELIAGRRSNKEIGQHLYLEDFFRALGPMDNVPHASNCDIAWFIVRYQEDTSGRARLARGGIRLTTFERAVEGLTASVPVSLEEFEARMMDKLEVQRRRAAAISPPAPS